MITSNGVSLLLMQQFRMFEFQSPYVCNFPADCLFTTHNGVAFSAGTDLNNIPIAPRPAGKVSNFVDPITLEGSAVGVCGVILFFEQLFGSISFFVNTRPGRNLRLDDCV